MQAFSYKLSLQDVERIFQQHRWNYRMTDELLFTIFEDVPMVFLADEDRNILMLFSQVVPEEGSARPEASASTQTYLLAANYRLALGTFSRDHRDGEIRYENSQLVIGPLSDEQVQIMIAAATGAVERHGPVIVNLLAGRMNLNQALARLETGGGMSGSAQAV
jgi:hypothetical protein